MIDRRIAAESRLPINAIAYARKDVRHRNVVKGRSNAYGDSVNDIAAILNGRRHWPRRRPGGLDLLKE